jgi:hypothetical protein
MKGTAMKRSVKAAMAAAAAVTTTGMAQAAARHGLAMRATVPRL